MADITLRALPSVLRRLFAAFLIVAATGYTLGVFFVDHTTNATPAGITERYIGSEASGVDIDALPPDREIQYEKSPAEMLNVTHTHLISLALLFLAVGGIFAFTSNIHQWLKSFLIIEPFLSIIATFGGIWLLRYHSPSWSILIAVSGTLMTICFYAMVGIALWQLLGRRDPVQ
ncbi:MAG: hypothetical protein C0600_00805 [Ignavibacteria bacterium]|nr:MAG: hypothetical protein C0600_00805 [Ignavibacteria bacterium]